MKYIASAIKSLVVVIKGPDARAGLKLSLSRIIGVIVPRSEESITIEKETEESGAWEERTMTITITTTTTKSERSTADMEQRECNKQFTDFMAKTTNKN